MCKLDGICTSSYPTSGASLLRRQVKNAAWPFLAWRSLHRWYPHNIMIIWLAIPPMARKSCSCWYSSKPYKAHAEITFGLPPQLLLVCSSRPCPSGDMYKLRKCRGKVERMLFIYTRFRLFGPRCGHVKIDQRTEKTIQQKKTIV